MKKLKVGIIGCGGIAKRAHAPNYKKLSESVEIVSVCDLMEVRAKDFAEYYGVPNYFLDYQNMLRNVELDAVSVCVPNKFHSEITIEALNQGCHVLCEKPPAISVDEAIHMANAAKKNKKHLIYGFHYRYSPEVQAVKRFIENGEFGEIYSASATAVRRRGIPGWGVFTNKELQGGGCLIDIGVHMLDTVLYLMGYPDPGIVLGSTYQKIGTKPGLGLMGEWNWENFSVEDMGRGMIRFKNGESILLDTAFAANVEKDEIMQVSLRGDQGGADVFPVKIFQEKNGSLIDITTPYLENDDYYELEIKGFVDTCLGNRLPINTPQEGVILHKIISALYKSAEGFDAVKIN
jgi:predicted dehydrogenase